MKNNFNFARLTDYFVSQFKSRRRSFFVMLGIALGLMLLIHMFEIMVGAYNVESNAAMSFVFGYVLVASIVLIGQTSFAEFHRPRCLAQAMMLPVSQAEKFVSAFVLNVVVLPLWLLLPCLVIDLAVSSVYGMMPGFVAMSQDGLAVFFDQYSGYICVFALYFLGSVLFRRNSFILTSVSLLGILLVIGLAIIFYIKLTTGLGADNGVKWAFYHMGYWTGVALDWGLAVVAVVWAWYRFISLESRK